MRSRSHQRVGTTAGIAIAVASLGLAGSVTAQTMAEFSIPSTGNYNATEIALGRDGNLWFTESVANKIGRITADGTVTEFPVPMSGTGFDPVTNPYIGPAGIALGPDRNLWFTEPSALKIGRITPGGTLTEFPIPAAGGSIDSGPDGNLWFTEGASNRVGRMNLAGDVAEFSIPTPDSGPDGIVAGPDGNLWFTEFNANAIGRISPAGVITEFPVPTPGSNPHRIASGPDGNLWFTEPGGGGIGRITPAGTITEFPTPTTAPGGIAAGPDGNLWFTDLIGSIGRITPAGAVTTFPVPTPRSRPGGIVAGQDGNIWFTEELGNAIGRLTIARCNADRRTLCLLGGRFAVTADWQIPSKGTAGHGSALPLTAETGYFSFFDTTNLEASIKILDGCSGANGHYWIFAAGLTNVAVALTVTDVQAQQTKTYTNPDGTAFQPIQDTSTFATCP